jgi:5'-nucleotidase
MDLTIDRRSKKVVATRLFPPQDLCAAVTSDRSGCADAEATGALAVEYEHRRVVADARITSAMAPELARVRARQARPLHVMVDSPLRRNPEIGAPLGRMFAEAMRESTPGADLAVNNNGIGGLRADLPRGVLTFGRLYDVFPFDNRVVRLTLTGELTCLHGGSGLDSAPWRSPAFASARTAVVTGSSCGWHD